MSRHGRFDRQFRSWGIADIFKGFGQSSLAKVGNTDISTGTVRQIYPTICSSLAVVWRHELTMGPARALGLDRPGAAADHRLSRPRTRKPGAWAHRTIRSETMGGLYSIQTSRDIVGTFRAARFPAAIRSSEIHRAALISRTAGRVGLRRQTRAPIPRASSRRSQCGRSDPVPERAETRSIISSSTAPPPPGRQPSRPQPRRGRLLRRPTRPSAARPNIGHSWLRVINPEEIGKGATCRTRMAKKCLEQRRGQIGPPPAKREVSQILFPMKRKRGGRSASPAGCRSKTSPGRNSI